MSLHASGTAGALDASPRPGPGAPPEQVRSAAGDGLVVEGIHRSYRDRPVLRDVSLTVPSGSCVLVSGANGVGKTTLLRVVAGIITADRGSVTFDGIDTERDRRAFQRRLGFLSAGDRGIYARLTVRQNLDFWGKIALLRKASRATAIEKALAQFGLSDLAGRRCDRLSMGQRQRVRLAMTFLHDPDLVLLDEPTTSLDQGGGDQVREAVRELRSRGGAVVYCAPTGEKHAVPFDQAFEIENGRLKA